jgi:hypothetical protein
MAPALLTMTATRKNRRPRTRRPELRAQMTEEAFARLDTAAETLGFLTTNSLAAVGLTALSFVPPSQFWRVLAEIRRAAIPHK